MTVLLMALARLNVAAIAVAVVTAGALYAAGTLWWPRRARDVTEGLGAGPWSFTPEGDEGRSGWAPGRPARGSSGDGTTIRGIAPVPGAYAPGMHGVYQGPTRTPAAVAGYADYPQARARLTCHWHPGAPDPRCPQCAPRYLGITDAS